MWMPIQAQALASLMKMTSLEILTQEKKQESKIDIYYVHPLEVRIYYIPFLKS